MSNIPDWSRPLPQSLVIPDLMMLQTLADVRTLLGHLPPEHREKKTGAMSPQNSMRPRAAHRWLKYSRCCARYWRWRALRTGRNNDVRCRLLPAEHADRRQ
jgi:hypothetical protein